MSTIIKSVSSHLMTSLLTWRNPQGSEENWLFNFPEIKNKWEHAGKIVSTEIGLALLTLTSVVETVSYAALSLASLTLYPFSNKPFKFLAELLKSSSFTIIWGLADAIIYNPISINIMTQESFARYWADTFNPTSIEMFRQKDKSYTLLWQDQHNARGRLIHISLSRHERETQVLINQGVNLIQQAVLSNASAETLELFNSVDPSICMFILTKAIYIYTFGVKKDDKIPNFFDPKTIKLILELRQKQHNEETVRNLEKLVENPAQFDTEPQDEITKTAFDRLRNIASEELQYSLFITRCWKRAIKQQHSSFTRFFSTI